MLVICKVSDCGFFVYNKPTITALLLYITILKNQAVKLHFYLPTPTTVTTVFILIINTVIQSRPNLLKSHETCKTDHSTGNTDKHNLRAISGQKLSYIACSHGDPA